MIEHIYVLQNQVQADVDGKLIPFGYRAIDRENHMVILTLWEVKNLEKEGKILNMNERNYIVDVVVKVDGGNISTPTSIPESFQEQLRKIGVALN